MSDNPLEPLPMSSTTHLLPPPCSGQELYFVSHNKSSSQVPRNLNCLGNFKGLGAIFLVFCVDR